MGEETPRGQSRPAIADLSSQEGWITTEVAARAVRVSPRTIRRYIDQGKLEAKPQGEGVRREWLVSVDSLHALRASRTIEEEVSDVDRGVEYADSIADVLREMSARLESRAEEAAELRVRLELTERAQSTLEDERRQVLQELEALRVPRGLSEPAEEQQGRGEPQPASEAGGAQEPTEALAGRGSGTARGSLWRRLFGR